MSGRFTKLLLFNEECLWLENFQGTPRISFKNEYMNRLLYPNLFMNEINKKIERNAL